MSLERLRSLMTKSAWVVLGFVLLAQLSRVPSVDDFASSMQRSATGRAIALALLTAWAVSALVLWAIALRYSWRRSKESGAAILPFVVLLFTNFVGALVYALFFTRKHAGRLASREARSGRDSPWRVT